MPYRFFLIIITLCIMIQCKEEDALPKLEPDLCLTTQSANHGDIIPGEYIVTFEHSPTDNSRSVEKASRIFNKYNVRSNQIREIIYGEQLHYIVTLTENEQAEIRKENDVKSIEPDRIISMCGCFSVEEPKLVTWNVNHVGYGDGRGKTAWILDSGIDYDHPDLNVDKDRSRSFISGISTAKDDNGHGTHIAGIIGAKNNSIGTLGVASGANLVGIKILDKDGNGKLSGALNALSYVRANGKAGDVVNISMSLDDISEILESEIKGIADRGLYFAIAAGNDSQMASKTSPARTDGNNIFTISAVDSLNRFASFSNYGNDAVDFAAPGIRVLSTYKGGKYAYMSGTSMAAPHVAGLLLINNGKINSKGFAIDDPDGQPDPIAHQ